MAKRKKKYTPKNHQVTWAQAVRDVLIASMNRGQLPIIGVLSLFFLIIWKMPSEDATKLAFSILDSLRAGELVSYIVLSVVIMGWFFHAKIMRTNFSKEVQRIGTQKTAIQSKAANTKFLTSDKK